MRRRCYVADEVPGLVRQRIVSTSSRIELRAHVHRFRGRGATAGDGQSRTESVCDVALTVTLAASAHLLFRTIIEEAEQVYCVGRCHVTGQSSTHR